MKPIADIRIFTSETENISGNALPSSLTFQSRKCFAVLQRIVMKLRECGFSLGEFDHLYVNFTPCAVGNGMALSKRGVDSYHPWYRYYDVHVDEELFRQLHVEANFGIVIEKVKALLISFFSSEAFSQNEIEKCFDEALIQGENMLMKFKEKTTAKRKAVLYLRCLDHMRYLPLLRVMDSQNRILLEADLPEMIELNALGNIRVTLNRITIEPRKNAFFKDFIPIQFDY